MAGVKEPIVFEAESIPRRPRQQSSSGVLRLTLRWCVISLAIIGAILLSIMLVVIGKAAIGAIAAITSPHTAIAYTPSSDGNSVPVVKPLINSTDTFDIQATIWLDVTQHLAQSESLPVGIKHYHYRHANGQEFDEAILHTDTLFNNVSMNSGLQHASTLIKIPIEPLYTQALGPATLRATFQVLPPASPSGNRFINASSIYPAYLPIGPRSPQSTRLKSAEKITPANERDKAANSISEAMEFSAISVDLLALLKSDIQLNNSAINLRNDYMTLPSMYDGSISSRAFINATASTGKDTGRIDRIIAEDHFLAIPHVRTRSRIVMIKEDRNFVASSFMKELQKHRDDLNDACRGFKDTQGRVSASELSQCQRPLKASIYENVLAFEEDATPSMKEEIRSTSQVNHFYAPFLTQSGHPAARRHHRTIPRYSPLALDTEEEQDFPLSKKKAIKEDACLVPMLEVDESKKYFEFQWDVTFSSHVHIRATMGEQIASSEQVVGKAKYDKDDGTEIRIRTTPEEEQYWDINAFQSADREHPNSRPELRLFQFVISIVSTLTFVFFTIAYWYTRKTSAGLSYRAQILTLIPITFNIISNIRGLTQNTFISLFTLGSIPTLLYSIYHLALVLSVLHHFDIASKLKVTRRQPTKKERDTRRLDDRIGWSTPAAVSSIMQRSISFRMTESISFAALCHRITL